MALLALIIDVILAVSYMGIFSPVWTAVILHPYIAPNAVLGRRLASYAQRHDVEWLTHVVYRTGFVRVYSERCRSCLLSLNPTTSPYFSFFSVCYGQHRHPNHPVPIRAGRTVMLLLNVFRRSCFRFPVRYRWFHTRPHVPLCSRSSCSSVGCCCEGIGEEYKEFFRLYLIEH